MSIGSNIKKRRLQLGMSQEKLAFLLGYKTRSTIAKIESGENSVSQKKIEVFARVLETTPELLSEEDDDSRTKIAAIILAGGKSVRNQHNVPNQFISVLGKPILVYCLETYETHPAIDDIYVVCLNGWEKIVEAYSKKYSITKLRAIIPGASTGVQSAYTGFQFIKKDYRSDDIIIYQESTRPLVTVDMISKLIQSCYKHDASIICHTMKDYVQFRKVEKKSEYLNRDAVIDIQSPEAYRLSSLEHIFDVAYQKSVPLSDTCLILLIHSIGLQIHFTEGSVNNYKVIRQEDLAVVSSLLQNGGN